MPRILAALPIALLFIIPLVLSLAFMLPGFTDIEAFRAFLNHPQVWGATQLTLTTAIISTLLSLICAIIITMGSHRRIMAETGAYLAVPHLALAIGLGFLIAPTGLIARIAGLALGWTEPPQWVTNQDPYGAALMAALVLKETPFLVWALASLLNRDDVKQMFAGQMKAARSLGHAPASIWIAVFLPQLLPRIVWPLIAVFTYGATVVDMALVIGPTQPPVLANLLWTDLNDGEPANNARGAAGVISLSFMILCLLWIMMRILHLGKPLGRRFFLGFPLAGNIEKLPSGLLIALWRGVYSLTLLFLFLLSVSSLYPYRNAIPQEFSFKGWGTLFADPRPILTSLALALASSSTAVISTIVWLETQPGNRDRWINLICGAALVIPAVVISLGQYRLFLAAGVTGTATAMFLAHVLPVMAYVFVMLAAPYRAYDRRWHATAQGLRSSRTRFLTRIKWPMLKAPILSAAAIGFAVSIAQYVPAQLAAAGRYTTLPMTAVTLASGGNRMLMAVYALALMLLPLLAFLLASHWGKARWPD
jgi:putative thiamine transport system permease protein